MSARRDYYEVLGVARGAEATEVKKAYRKCAMEFHPDRNPGDAAAEERFKEAAEAFEVLSDPEKRRVYDQFGHEGLRGSGFQGFTGAEDVFAHFGDLFGDLFGGGSRRSGGPQRGSDLSIRLEIPFADAVRGIEKEISIPRRELCDDCGGSGAAAGTSAKACGGCNGTGQVVHRQGFFTLQTTCPTCRGEGTRIEKPCAGCAGAGVKQRQSTLSVKIPAGVDDGQTLRIGGAGQPGARGGRAGHLYVQLAVVPDPRFVREEFDIHTEVEISMIQAALGCTVTVPTLSGTDESVEIEPGTQPADVVVLRGKGIPVLGQRGHGHQHVHVRVVIPRKLDAEHEKVLRELAAGMGVVVSPRKGMIETLLGRLK